jgi:hypothetical protein
MTFDPNKPLFVALMREHFLAFEQRTKRHEWRRYGSRWNEKSCFIGRAVTLSLGYSGRRLTGQVVSFRRCPAGVAQAALFGRGTLCAVIGIKID